MEGTGESSVRSGSASKRYAEETSKANEIVWAARPMVLVLHRVGRGSVKVWRWFEPATVEIRTRERVKKVWDLVLQGSFIVYVGKVVGMLEIRLQIERVAIVLSRNKSALNKR